MSDIPILAVGDPHGCWSPVHDACRRAPRAGVLLLLGDYDLAEPLADVLGEELSSDWVAKWIRGNHDTDNSVAYDCLVGSLPDDDIGGRSIDVAGLRIGGLGGTYRGKVWYPRTPDAPPPRYQTRAEYMRQVRLPERWRKGLPLGMRSAIFPEDHAALMGASLDVLLTHEAPPTVAMRDKGFQGLAELLDATGARLCIHGHHHRTYSEDLVLPSGRTCRVRGLAIGEVWNVEVPR